MVIPFFVTVSKNPVSLQSISHSDETFHYHIVLLYLGLPIS